MKKLKIWRVPPFYSEVDKVDNLDTCKDGSIGMDPDGFWNKFGCVIVGYMNFHNPDIDGKSWDKRAKLTDKISRLL